MYILEPPIELQKIETLKVDTLNVIDIMSMTDSDTEREIHQIDINQEVVIPNLFSDDDDEQEFDSDENKKASKLMRQRCSMNQTKAKDSDLLLMETSLMILDPSPLSPPPFSPPPLPLSPNTNIVTTPFHREVGFLSLPLTSTTMDPPPTGEQRRHRHHHKHHHHKQTHRHSMAVGRTAPIDERGHTHSYKSSHQPPETEIVLSPSKLGQ